MIEQNYLIGVPKLDAQHRVLFSAIDRIKSIVMDGDDERNRRLCKEALKLLLDHTTHHFQDEEEYMRSIQFPRYEQHKAQHEAIKDSLLALQGELISSNFAPPVVKRLLGTMTAWLAYHTVEMDSAIGKNTPRIDCSDSAAVAMELAATRIISEVFGEKITLLSSSYQGLPEGDKIFCMADCSHSDGRRFRVMEAISEQVVLHAISKLFSSQQSHVDETALSAMEELCTLLSIHFLRNYQNGEFFHVDKTELLSQSQFLSLQMETAPLCSLLFDSAYGAFLTRVWTL